MNAISIANKVTQALPFLRPIVSRLAIDYLATRSTPRPRPYSLWSPEPKPAPIDQPGPITDYTSWPSLTDRTFSGRHLPPADKSYIASLPTNDAGDPQKNDWGKITALFHRQQMHKDRSSVLFSYFAQWFTDSFLRVSATDRRQNTSNHEIDLCQIYGLTEKTARMLRSMQGGRLSSQKIAGEEYPEYLYEAGADGILRVRGKYADMPHVLNGQLEWILSQLKVDDARKLKIYATGLERGNSSIGYVALSTVFLREHNRLCAALATQNPEWNDERLFQTARMINIAMLLRIVVEDYINHIAGGNIFVFDNTFAENKNWYRTNWITLEFDMVYRWHGLVPDTVDIGGIAYTPDQFQADNVLLEKVGVAELIHAATLEAAGKIGLFNTPPFLLPAERQTIKMGRDFQLRSYNEYRTCFGLDQLTQWSELTSDTTLQERLKELYGDVGKLEFVVGLFAEEATDGILFGSLLLRMVALDAFTQALTNPILSKNIFNESTLTRYGVGQIAETSSLQDMVNRNIGGKEVSARFDHARASA